MKTGLIGTGRMAHALLYNLKETEYSISSIAGRSEDKLATLAEAYQLDIRDMKSLDGDLDILFIAVSDSAISEVASDLTQFYPKTLFIHHSGATPLEALTTDHPHKAVLWPIDSLSASPKKLNATPWIVDGNTESALQTVRNIAQCMSSMVHYAGWEDRRILHLTAVLCNNFTNHLLAISADLLESTSFDLSLYSCIMQTTLENAMQGDPGKKQTGPAVRQDSTTMKTHEHLLPEHYRTLYRVLSQSIIQKHENNRNSKSSNLDDQSTADE